MAQRTRPSEHSPDSLSDIDTPEKATISNVTEEHKPLTFPLRWRAYSLVWFLAIGTSSSLIIGLIISVLLFSNIVGTPLSLWWEWGLVFLPPGVIVTWMSYRMVQEFRETITFSPTGIVLNTRREQQTVSWNQIQHMEALLDLIAVQLPTTAVVLHPTLKHRAQLLALAHQYLPPSRIVAEAQILKDFWCRARAFWVNIAPLVVYIPFGVLVAIFMGVIMGGISDDLGFGGFVGVCYLAGYLLVGGMKMATLTRRMVFTTQGILDTTFPKYKLLGLVFSLPITDPQAGARRFSKREIVPWMPWAEITAYLYRTDYGGTMVFRSSHGHLELWGLAKKADVKEVIEHQVIRSPNLWRRATTKHGEVLAIRYDN